MSTRVRSFTLLLMVATVIGGWTSVLAGIGFQATLDGRSSVVSGYAESNREFSFSLYSKQYPAIQPDMSFTPRLDSSSFEDSSLVFATNIRGGQSLVPLAVNAQDYMTYRLAFMERQKFNEAIQNRHKLEQDKKGRTGLSIGVPLPKRLDRVFGEGGGNLKVSGYRQIRFAGRSQWTDGATSDQFRQSKFPTLDMDQRYQFDIEGTIGSKISVRVSEDSQTDIPLTNRILLRYKGNDDDILKLVEAGNTTLDLPNTRFVGYSSRIQGLFGFKVQAKVGHLEITGIASQEKGSSERSSISAGGSASQAQYIRDFAYAEGRIYDLGATGELQGQFTANDKIINIQVFEEVKQNNSTNDGTARLYIDPIDTVSNPQDLQYAESLFVKIVDRDRYETRDDSINNRHYLVFKTPQGIYNALGVYFEYLDAETNTIIKVGDPNTAQGKPRRLKMLLPLSNDYSRTHPTWDLMWRNVYNVGKVGSIEDLDVRIFKGKPGLEESGTNLDYQDVAGNSTGKYIAVLGLDQYSGTNRGQDNKVDARYEIYEPEWGLLMFPSRKPFASDTTFPVGVGGGQTTQLALKVPKIYEYDSETERANASEYYIQSSSRVRQDVIRLGRANIIEGSDRLTANGVVLDRDTDYKIDYSFGQITLLSARAKDPNSSLTIDFEYAPFLSLQKKTLLGARLAYDWSDDFQVGSTVIYKSDKAEDRKPRVGEETAKMFVFDVDARLRLHPHFLTKAVNSLPLIATDVPSTLNLSAEVAQSRPNPNVNGLAYVDDFESTLEQVSLGMTRTFWTHASRPSKGLASTFIPAYLPDTLKRMKILWHNLVGGVPVDEVYNREVAQGQGTITPLRLIFRPDTSGAPTWGGIMTYIGQRLDNSKVRLFEVRLKGRRGKMHFDFGQISDDIDHDLIPDTEDRDDNKYVEDAEDIGLDGKSDFEESGIGPDPHGDNWYFEGQGICPAPDSICASSVNPASPYYYEWINGTEGNGKDLATLGRPDKEALSGSSLNQINSYLSYTIDLSDTTFLVDSSEYNEWRTYRIPLRDTLAVDRNYSTSDTIINWSRAHFVRVWFENDVERTDPAAQYDTVMIANWYVVQSAWDDTLIAVPGGLDSSKFYIASVSTEDNRSFVPPPGAEEYRDPTTGVLEPQRAMSLVYENLQTNDTCLTQKNLITAESYSGYRKLQMWVHGDNVNPAESLLFFFRVGTDSINYYEYRTYVGSGWSNKVEIDFNAITALKDAAIKADTAKLPKIDTTDGNYRVKGLPNINQVDYYAVGMVNQASTPITGQVWVDELQVNEVRRDVGKAGRFSMQGNLADILTYGFEYNYQDPFFRNISSATRGGGNNNLGSGLTNENYSYNLSTSLERFLPRNFGVELPLSFSYGHSTQTPLLRTNTDVVLPAERRQEEQSVSQTRTFSASESFKRKTKNPLFTLLLNRQQLSFSYGRNSSQTPTNPYSFSESYNFNGSYDMSWQRPPRISPFAWLKPIPILRKTAKTTMALYPTVWRWNGTFTRSLSFSEDINEERISSIQRDFNMGTNISYPFLDNLNLTYNWSTQRDLREGDFDPLFTPSLKIGREMRGLQNFSSTYDPKLFGTILTSGLSYTVTYVQSFDRTSSTTRADMNNNWAISGNFNHRNLFAQRKLKEAKAVADTVRQGDSLVFVTKTVRPGRPFYDYPLAAIRFLTGWIEPISYKYSRSYNASTPGLLDKPSLAYRFGLHREIGLQTVRASQYPSAGEGEIMEAGTGFTLLSGISTDVRFRRSTGRDLVRQGQLYERVTTDFPDLNIKIGKFKRLPLIRKYVNKFIDIFQPQTSYSRQEKKDFNMTDNFLVSKSIIIDQTPLLQINFRLIRSLSISGSYGQNNLKEERYSSFSGALQTQTESDQNTLAASARYSFSAPGGLAIPLFGKVKFTSSVNIDLAVRIRNQITKTSNVGGPFVVNTDQSEFAVSPTISYQFSQQIRGGIQGSWQDTDNRLTKRKSHVRELSIFAEIRF